MAITGLLIGLTSPITGGYAATIAVDVLGIAIGAIRFQERSEHPKPIDGLCGVARRRRARGRFSDRQIKDRSESIH
jgi:hypothetical protein